MEACKDWNDIPAGSAKWLRLLYSEQGQYPEPFISHLFSPCYHCAKPACVLACPAGAITKREADGIIVVDRQKCLGNADCQTLCLNACPYRAPQFGPEKGARMQKCNLCLERWQENKKPVCVEACPVRALDAGPLEEMKAKHGDGVAAEGFRYSPRFQPSVVFKPKRSHR